MSLIANKYKLIEKIGSGSFGSIYKAVNIITKEMVAIKIEPINNGMKLLKNEALIYQYLSNTKKEPGIPSVKWFGKDETNYYMVINLLGNSLQFIKDNNFVFSLKIVLEIGVKILLLLKSIHDKGLVHRDIKPDNFLLNINEDKLYIIDFGFCKTYYSNKNHIKMKETSKMIGTPNYASINSHNHYELSRRDDLESLGYMLIYLYIGHLDWENEKSDSKMIVLKKSIVHSNEIPLILISFIKDMMSLKFEECPDYSGIINIFNNEICK